MKFIILLAIFIGEFLFIFFEIYLAGKFRTGGNTADITKTILLVVPWAVIFSLLILWGYIYGYKYFEKIWIITIISWSSILIIEPVLNYLIFKELPVGNTLVASVLAVVAIIVSVL